jgi:uncharacterized membrane protein
MDIVKEALKPEFSMLLNVALAAIPLMLAAVLFRPEWRRGPVWWFGLAVLIVFLPNTVYIFTDLVHLVLKIRKEPPLPMGAIVLLVIPQYILFVGGAFEVYALSLVWLGRYMAAAGYERWVRPMEWTLHGLCAIGIYLGRVVRLNSWDIFKDPVDVFTEVFDAFDSQRALIFMTAAFVVIAVIYGTLKFLTICVIEHFERRGRHHRHRSVMTPAADFTR